MHSTLIARNEAGESGGGVAVISKGEMGLLPPPGVEDPPQLLCQIPLWSAAGVGWAIFCDSQISNNDAEEGAGLFLQRTR